MVPQLRALNKVNRHLVRIWPNTINRVNISLERSLQAKIVILGQTSPKISQFIATDVAAFLTRLGGIKILPKMANICATKLDLD